MGNRIGTANGFTMIELVVVIVVSGILTLSIVQFISAPIDAYVDQSRRARLVAAAESALDRITIDVRAALPNSLRVGCGGTCLEYLRTASGGRYRSVPPGDPLSFLPADADTSFDVLGALALPAGLAAGVNPNDCVNGLAACLVVYNTGFAGTDAWRSDNIATVTTLTANSIGFDNSGFSSGDPSFPAASPGQRFFLVDSPVSFICDPVVGTIRRYEGYNIRSSHTDVDSHAELMALSNPAESALLADSASACRFSYSPGTPTRNAVLTISLTLSEAGEQVRLLQQIGVLNST